MKNFILISGLIIFIIISLLPVILIFADSVIHNGNFSLESYKGLLYPEIRQLLSETLAMASGTAFFSLIIGVPLGFLLTRTNLYFNRYFKYLYLIPLMIPSHVNAVAWIFLLGTNGYLNLFIKKILLTDKPFFIIYGVKGAVLVLTLSYFPIITLLTVTGLKSADKRLEEAGIIIADKFSVFRKITLPLIMPNIIAGAIFVFIFSVSDYGVPSLLRVNTYSVEIFAQFSAFYDSQKAVAFSMPIIIIVLFLTGLQHYYMKDREYISVETVAESPCMYDLNYLRLPATAYVLLIIMLSSVIPISALIAESGSVTAYKIAFKTAYKQIFNSFVLSFATATVSVILNFFISYIIEKTEWYGKKFADLLSFIPFAVPGAILGIGLIKLWNRPSADFIYESFIILVFAYIARFSPFVIRSVSGNFKQINKNLEESAILSGASWMKYVLKILIPLTKPGLIAGWIITFIFCMGELGTTLLVVPPGKETLSIRIYSLMHYGAGNLVACLCLILIAVTLIPVCFLILRLLSVVETMNKSND